MPDSSLEILVFRLDDVLIIQVCQNFLCAESLGCADGGNDLFG
jgi:hypothetical protein